MTVTIEHCTGTGTRCDALAQHVACPMYTSNTQHTTPREKNSSDSQPRTHQTHVIGSCQRTRSSAASVCLRALPHVNTPVASAVSFLGSPANHMPLPNTPPPMALLLVFPTPHPLCFCRSQRCRVLHYCPMGRYSADGYAPAASLVGWTKVFSMVPAMLCSAFSTS